MSRVHGGAFLRPAELVVCKRLDVGKSGQEKSPSEAVSTQHWAQCPPVLTALKINNSNGSHSSHLVTTNLRGRNCDCLQFTQVETKERSEGFNDSPGNNEMQRPEQTPSTHHSPHMPVRHTGTRACAHTQVHTQMLPPQHLCLSRYNWM